MIMSVWRKAGCCGQRSNEFGESSPRAAAPWACERGSAARTEPPRLALKQGLRSTSSRGHNKDYDATMAVNASWLKD